ncbi:Ankyrin repeat and BTB/POZ domain-containing protein 1 [Pleodorina starrii]|uniref:Ankyrin repeat and BTB/POZ domain-containing protein 1 n=1 Tax=Pleodorina starrii TaxID=330485 RepID=A0A9W6BZE0_9CHLO|nr:Ankyrin repeat and BTB/POZ domain-containing protein 1 [Pleodorina starrii]GLC66239.1 Ankyrin repeat and BTB/POZ domain-containing protein 1 [Pleodorina starrii]
MYTWHRTVHTNFTVTGIVVRSDSSNSSSSSSNGSSSADNQKSSAAASGRVPAPETLVFHSTGIKKLVNCNVADGDASSACMFSQIPVTPSLPFSGASCPVYEPTTDCVLFVVNRTAILELDRSNGIRLIAGNQYTGRSCGSGGDGRGAAARFLSISALAPDGLGSVYVADGDRIRKLDLASRRIETLPDSWPEGDCHWVGLAYDGAAHVLMAATQKAVCLIGKSPSSGNSSNTTNANSSKAARSRGGMFSGRRKAAFVHLVAGDWAETAGAQDGEQDGAGAAARFTGITSLLAGADRQLFILDGFTLRIMDPDCFVSTVAVRTAARPTESDKLTPTCLCVLPGGDLAVGSCNIRIIRGQPRPGPSTPALGGRNVRCCPRPLHPSPMAADLHKAITSPSARPPVAAAGSDTAAAAGSAGAAAAGSAGAAADASDGAAAAAAASCSGSGSTVSSAGGALPHLVTVTAGGAARFTVHRHVLKVQSEYFKRLLDPESGFTDSGAAEVSLPDADPDALAWLLTYLYTGEMFVPEELLWPAAALARRLLLPASCTERLQEWLLATVTPATVISDLMWAEQYGLDELALQCKAYLLRNRRYVDMGELVERQPDLAAGLLRELVEGA